MKFGEKLRKSRLEHNWTQEELAEKAHISRRAIINYENGSTYPKSRETYKLLADVLEVDVDSLKNETDDFILKANEVYGYKGRKQAEEIIDAVGALFAGGELSDEDMDGVMQAMQEHYWRAKEINKKYTPKKFLKGNK